MPPTQTSRSCCRNGPSRSTAAVTPAIVTSASAIAAISRRHRRLPAGAETVPQSVSVGAQVIARWVAVPPYADGRDNPRVLPRGWETARRPTFDRLVASVTTDVRPRAVLDDLLSHGLVALEDDEWVRLDTAGSYRSPGRRPGHRCGDGAL